MKKNKSGDKLKDKFKSNQYEFVKDLSKIILDVLRDTDIVAKEAFFKSIEGMDNEFETMEEDRKVNILTNVSILTRLVFYERSLKVLADFIGNTIDTQTTDDIETINHFRKIAEKTFVIEKITLQNREKTDDK